MTPENAPAWLTYLEHDVMLAGGEQGLRVHEVVIKVQPSTLFYILKVVTSEGPKVAFGGGRTLSSLSRSIRDRILAYPEKWRPDKYFKT